MENKASVSTTTTKTTHVTVAPDFTTDAASATTAIAAVSAIIVVIIFAVAIICYHCTKDNYRRRHESFDPSIPLSEQSCNAPLNPEIEIKFEDLTIELPVIGHGHYGKVQLGRLKRGKPPIQRTLVVAIKTPLHGDDRDEMLMLRSEVIKLSKVGNHPNILKLYGVVSSHMINNELYVCLEYCKHKSLCEFLTINQTKFGTEFEFALLPKFACDIARGMTHLESRGFIHGDLAARNLLVTEHFVIKIADFGHAKDSPYYELYVQKSIPIRWAAIEVLETNGHYTPTVKPSNQSPINFTLFFAKKLVQCFIKLTQKAFNFSP